MPEDKGLVGPVLKVLFGDAGRFVLLGVALAALYFEAMDFRESLTNDNAATRRALAEYIAANEEWRKLTAEDRKRLVDKVERRLQRLYSKNGWEYQGLTE